MHQKIPYLDLKFCFTDAFNAMQFLRSNTVDLLFLDIKMPDINGIDFFNTLARKPMAIFTTAYSEHAVQGFDADAIDYLLKPFSFPRFLKACNKAYAQIDTSERQNIPDHIFLKTGYEQVKLVLEDLMFAEASGNYVTFVTDQARVLTRMTFKEAMDVLPASRFARVHRSYIISIGKIKKIERHQVMVSNKLVPVSEGYYEQLLTIVKDIQH
jgi:two-component system LytT family response regulator